MSVIRPVKAINDIANERARQDEMWGEQNHPDGTGSIGNKLEADFRRKDCNAAFNADNGTWRQILLEEVYEALAESDPEKLREELVQTAAVCVAWIQAIDRRNP